MKKPGRQNPAHFETLVVAKRPLPICDKLCGMRSRVQAIWKSLTIVVREVVHEERRGPAVAVIPLTLHLPHVGPAHCAAPAVKDTRRRSGGLNA
jgi:hypothetical protein